MAGKEHRKRKAGRKADKKKSKVCNRTRVHTDHTGQAGIPTLKDRGMDAGGRGMKDDIRGHAWCRCRSAAVAVL
jgi:hypothetical protein